LNTFASFIVFVFNIGKDPLLLAAISSSNFLGIEAEIERFALFVGLMIISPQLIGSIPTGNHANESAVITALRAIKVSLLP
jgi:hypothetical protein